MPNACGSSEREADVELSVALGRCPSTVFSVTNSAWAISGSSALRAEVATRRSLGVSASTPLRMSRRGRAPAATSSACARFASARPPQRWASSRPARSGSRESARWPARRRAAPRSVSARECSSSAGDPRAPTASRRRSRPVSHPRSARRAAPSRARADPEPARSSTSRGRARAPRRARHRDERRGQAGAPRDEPRVTHPRVPRAAGRTRAGARSPRRPGPARPQAPDAVEHRSTSGTGRAAARRGRAGPRSRDAELQLAALDQYVARASSSARALPPARRRRMARGRCARRPLRLPSRPSGYQQRAGSVPIMEPDRHLRSAASRHGESRRRSACGRRRTCPRACRARPAMTTGVGRRPRTARQAVPGRPTRRRSVPASWRQVAMASAEQAGSARNRRSARSPC